MDNIIVIEDFIQNHYIIIAVVIGGLAIIATFYTDLLNIFKKKPTPDQPDITEQNQTVNINGNNNTVTQNECEPQNIKEEPMTEDTQ